MHDFHVKEAKEMQAGALADRVHELKETEKGVEHMCKEMEQLCNERELEKAKKMAINFSRIGMSAEEIALAVEENVQLVRDWLSGTVTTAR